MKKRNFYALSIFVLLLGPLLLTGADSSKKITIKMATLAPKGSSWETVLGEMGQKWREASNGQVVLQVYPGGVVGDENDMVRKIRIGQIQAAAISSNGLSEIDRGSNALMIPLLLDSYEELDYVRNRLSPQLEERIQKKGFVVLNWGDAGWARFFTQEPMTKPAELQRMKLFTWAGAPDTADLWKAAGFNPVPLAITDLLPGLQTGLINAFAAPPLTALAFQWFGLAKHMADLKLAPVVGATVISKSTWDRISPDVQEAMRKAAREAGDRLNQEVRRLDDEAIQAMQERGLTVHHVDETATAEWINTVKTAYPKLRDTMIPGDLFDEVLRLRDEFRAGNR